MNSELYNPGQMNPAISVRFVAKVGDKEVCYNTGDNIETVSAYVNGFIMTFCQDCVVDFIKDCEEDFIEDFVEYLFKDLIDNYVEDIIKDLVEDFIYDFFVDFQD